MGAMDNHKLDRILGTDFYYFLVKGTLKSKLTRTGYAGSIEFIDVDS